MSSALWSIVGSPEGGGVAAQRLPPSGSSLAFRVAVAEGGLLLWPLHRATGKNHFGLLRGRGQETGPSCK